MAHRSTTRTEPRCNRVVKHPPNQQEYKDPVNRSLSKAVTWYMNRNAYDNAWLNPCIVLALALTAVAPCLCSREPSKTLTAARRFTTLVDFYPCQVNVKARPACGYQTLMYDLPRALASRRMSCLRVAAEYPVELTHLLPKIPLALRIECRITRTCLRQVARCCRSRWQGLNRAL
jgi:hypothetical protein